MRGMAHHTLESVQQFQNAHDVFRNCLGMCAFQLQNLPTISYPAIATVNEKGNNIRRKGVDTHIPFT